LGSPTHLSCLLIWIGASNKRFLYVGEHKVRPYNGSQYGQTEKVLPRQNRLTSAQFDRAFNQSQVVRHPLVQARAHGRSDGSNAIRAAFVVPKKQGKAHDRNRTKRRLRERFRLHARRDEPGLRGCDLILMTTPATATATTDELDAALDDVLRRLGKRMNGSNRSEAQPTRVETSPTAAQNAQAPNEAAPLQEAFEEQHALEPTSLEAARSRDVCEVEVTRSEEARALETAGVEVARSEDGCEVEVTPSEMQWNSAPVSWLFIALIRFYQRAISPSLPPSCRFFPTCSVYTLGAIERHGPLWGTLLGAWRICRCTPLHAGGFDPVPETLPVFPSHFLGLKPKRDA